MEMWLTYSLLSVDHSALYIKISACLVASLATLSLVAAYLLFKVDLVLAYRRLLRIFSKQGKFENMKTMKSYTLKFCLPME